MTEDRPLNACARRDRQLAEIAALAAAGKLERAGGLAREHASAFPDDADRLEHLGFAYTLPRLPVRTTEIATPASE